MKEELKNLIIDNENLIYSIINKYTYYFDKDDLFQVGVIGLINAYKNYNKDKNTKFSSYAYFYILGEVKKYISESSLLKYNKELSKLNIAISKAKIYLTQKLLREPSIYEISLFLEIDEKQVLEAIEASNVVESLDFMTEDDNNLYAYISKEEKAYDSSILDLKDSVSKLDDFSKKIILNRYSLDKSQSETAKELGITQVQVSRKEKEILQRLRTRLE